MLACAPYLASAVLVIAQPQAKAPYWPNKGGDLNHSGFARFTAPFNLSKPTWVFEEPRRPEKGERNPVMKVFHSSPVIDGDFNIYIQSTTGFVYSLDKRGELRWEFETSSGNPGNVALDGSGVYTVSDDGTVFAIDAATGRELWRNKVAQHAPDDTHSLTVVDGTVLTACNFKAEVSLNDAVCALRASDGTLKWTYSMREASGRKDAMATNQMHSIVDGNVIFTDGFGAIFSVSLADGKENWHTQNVTSMLTIKQTNGMFPYGTTASGVVGNSGLVYNPFNLQGGGKGTVRAHSAKDGSLVWQRNFDLETNVAVAAGKLQPSGRSVIVVPMGKNPNPMAMNPQEAQLFKLGVLKPVPNRVMALDANTGETVWTFTTPTWDGRCAGSLVTLSGSGDLCAPDNFGMPTIGADGTVYLNWSGGHAFAVRDTDGDGVVNILDPKEVSSYHHGYGANGATALAPGFAVAPSCRQLLAWSA